MDYFKPAGTNNMLSRFTIGCVQIGLTYGIDSLGKPPLEKSIEILSYAVNNGINVFDTSPIYGDSEEIIGDFLKRSGKENKFISTKLEKIPAEVWDNNNLLSDKIRYEFNLSCKKLGVDKIAIYFVHVSSDAFKNNGKVLDTLCALKAEGMIDSVGVSIYSEDEFKQCIEDKRIDIVQAPFNILDRRLDRSKMIQEAEKRNLYVCARSIYLQGLLLMKTDKIPDYLREAKKFIKKLNEISEYSGYGIKELCVKYVLEVKGISSIVIGINSLEQLKENISLFNSKPLDLETIKAINDLPVPPDYILDPRMWVGNI